MTTLYLMLLIAAHGFDRPIDRRVNLLPCIALFHNLLSCRGKVLVELLKHRGTLANFGEAHGFEAQLSLRKGHLQHALLGDSEFFAKLGRNGDLSAPEGPNNPCHTLS